MTNNLQISQLAISQIQANPNNVRKHPKKQISMLMAGIRELGFLVPIIVDETGTLLAGHARVQAAQKLKIDKVPGILVSHLTEAQKRAFIIADNRLCEMGKWDINGLKVEFQAIIALGYNVEITGYTTGEVDIIIDGEISDGPEVVQEVSGPAVSRLGDIWQMGRHKIICGDSTKLETYLLLMREVKAMMVFTDPPYNVKIKGHVSGLGKTKHREFVMASGDMSSLEFTDFLEQFMQHSCTVSVDGAIHYICMDAQHLQELLDAAAPVYGRMKQLCVWNKDNAGMGAFYRSKHELVAVFKHGEAAHINNFGLGENGRYRTNVWDYPCANSMKRGNGRKDLKDHPTPKPVALVADAIRDCSHRDDVILDPFLGGGTTIIAAERTGRICYGVELDPLYVDLCVRRWEKFTGKTAVLEGKDKSFAQISSERSLEAADEEVSA